MSKSPEYTKLITCVVPIYNEGTHIADFVEALDKTLNSLPYPYEILLIDDGSYDTTPQIIEKLRGRFKLLKS